MYHQRMPIRRRTLSSSSNSPTSSSSKFRFCFPSTWGLKSLLFGLLFMWLIVVVMVVYKLSLDAQPHKPPSLVSHNYASTKHQTHNNNHNKYSKNTHAMDVIKAKTTTTKTNRGSGSDIDKDIDIDKDDDAADAPTDLIVAVNKHAQEKGKQRQTATGTGTGTGTAKVEEAHHDGADTDNDDTKRIVGLISILKSQAHLPAEQRVLYKAIELPVYGEEYLQPPQIYQEIKKNFENAEWQPKSKQTQQTDKDKEKQKEKQKDKQKDKHDIEDVLKKKKEKKSKEKHEEKISKSKKEPRPKPKPPQQKADKISAGNSNLIIKNADPYHMIYDGNIPKDGTYKCLYYCKDQVYDRQCILKHIQYWLKPLDRYQQHTKTGSDWNLPLLHSDFAVNTKSNARPDFGFITFKSDCGGFNNLRQAYEYIIAIAWLTQRTFVFPVTEGWYLIDWGTITVNPPPNTRGISNYHDFYDVGHLAKVIPVLNLTQFLDESRHRGSANMDAFFKRLPEEYHMQFVDVPADGNQKKKDLTQSLTTETWNWDTRQHWKKWLNLDSVQHGYSVPFGLGRNIVLWPNATAVKRSQRSKFYGVVKNKAEPEHSEKSVDANVNLNGHAGVNALYNRDPQLFGEVTLGTFVGGRTEREYFAMPFANRTHIHFPSCLDSDMSNYRYLGQIASSIAFADYSLELKFKKLMRDFVHLQPLVFEYASYVIAYLGLFQFNSAHIRRNDFQFKGSWISAEKSFANMYSNLMRGDGIKNGDKEPKTKTKTKVYIASDAPQKFFNKIVESYPDIEIYRFYHFFNAQNGSLYETFVKLHGKALVDAIPKARKLVGLIEMVICAAGNRFFGTVSSTYSSYITRLRGYIDAPDKGIWFHNNKNERKWRFRATEYMTEMPDMWEDIQHYC